MRQERKTERNNDHTQPGLSKLLKHLCFRVRCDYYYNLVMFRYLGIIKYYIIINTQSSQTYARLNPPKRNVYI